LLETVTSTTSVDYTPARSKDETAPVTIAVQYNFTSGNSVQVTGKGCMGDVTFTIENGALVADFEFMGALVGVTDETALVLTSPDTGVVPQLVTGATATVAAGAFAFDKFELKAGNTVDLSIKNSDSSGYDQATVRNREPEFSTNPRMQRLASSADYTRFAAGTQAAISVATATVSGLKWTISAPKASLKGTGLKPGLRGQETTWEQVYSLRESSGNDEWKILQSA
jgi:hypothetical protein